MQDPKLPSIKTREATVVRDAATEGQPAVGKEQTRAMLDGSFVDSTLVRLTYCAGCNSVLHIAAEICGMCCVCQGLLDKACSELRCSVCARCVCKSDSERVGGGQVICRSDFREQFKVHVIGIGVAILAGVGLIALVHAIFRM